MKVKSIMLAMVVTGIITTPTIISANSVSNTIGSENRKLSTGDNDYTNVHWHNTSDPNTKISVTVPATTEINLGESLDLTSGTFGTSFYGEHIPDLTNIPLDCVYPVPPEFTDKTELAIDITDPQNYREHRQFDTDAFGKHSTYDSKIFTPTKAGTYKIYYTMYLTMGGFNGAGRTIVVNDNKGNVTAKYVDESGNKLADDIVKSGDIGDTYTTEQKSIDGYTFKEVQGNTTGKFTDKAQTVTYVYTKNAKPVVGSNVIAKYVDEKGNKIANDVVKKGNIGDTYTTKQKSIDGYTFKEVQGNAAGKFTDKAQIVTYVYTKKSPAPVVPNNDDQTNNKTASSNKPVQKQNKSSKPAQKSAATMLPKTSVEKAGELVGYIFVIAALVGLSIFDYKRRKQRKNKDN